MKYNEASQSLRARLVSCFRSNQVGGSQLHADWLPARNLGLSKCMQKSTLALALGNEFHFRFR
jgi:hypothetical protein